MKITDCRYCGSALTPVLDLGHIPLVNYFPSVMELSTQKKYPLRLVHCDECGLLQLDEIIPASEIFSTYHYVTGASAPLIQELSSLAAHLIESRHLTKNSRVLDIGSNDGTLLSFFHAKGIQVLGVEPSVELSQYARKRNIETLNTFFTKDVAKQIVKKYGQCDVVCATHVLANIIDLGDFMDGIRLVLSPNGVCIIEVADAEVMIQNGQFDAIYHEHYSYFSSKTLDRIATEHGLYIQTITHSDVQGGAIRIELTHVSEGTNKRTYTSVDLQTFAKQVNDYKKTFKSLLKTFKGEKIVGFGAPAKSVTFTSFMGLSEGEISYIVDSTEQKQGRFLPGTKIPIYPQSHIVQEPPDAVIIFSWNYRSTIVDFLKKTMKKGTTIITPFPSLKVETI